MNEPDMQTPTRYLRQHLNECSGAVALFGSWTYWGHSIHQMTGSRQEDNDEA